MPASKPKEQAQDTRQENTRLDDRYGKIGISAVAAAVCHQGERCNRREVSRMTEERE